jgi:phytoene synthase
LLLTPFELVTADVRARNRDRYLSVLYAPAPVRPAWMALHALDLELESVVAGTTEPMIGEIRLAWWREALEGLDAGRVPAQPLLQLIAAEVLPRGVSGAALAVLEDRWAGLIGSDEVPEAHFAGGGDLFVLLARLAGGNEAQARALGAAWAAGEAPPSGSVAAPLRPLLGLAKLAAGDAARARAGAAPQPRGSVRRQLKLLGSVAFGR